MILESFSVGPLGCNCTIVGDEATKEALVVDPGGDADAIDAVLTRHGLRATTIVHTHTHIDHVGATAAVQRAQGAAARIHEEDLFLYQMLPVQTAMLGLGAVPESCELDRWLTDGDVITLGSVAVHVLHTPGHTPGSCCFEVRDGAASEDQAVVLAGDTLFRGSVGRTDLWGGDQGKLVTSIRQKLLSLPAPTRVICGHGPDTTVGFEQRMNPFVGAGAR